MHNGVKGSFDLTLIMVICSQTGHWLVSSHKPHGQLHTAGPAVPGGAGADTERHQQSRVPGGRGAGAHRVRAVSAECLSVMFW